MNYIYLVIFRWFPENTEHVEAHGLSPETVEAVFVAEDFRVRETEDRGRFLAEGTTAAGMVRVVFHRTGPGEVFVVTAHKVSTRRRRT